MLPREVGPRAADDERRRAVFFRRGRAMESGTIICVKTQGYGFIKPVNGERDLFFHKSDLMPPLEFSEQLVERRVKFALKGSAKGDRAACIEPAS
jgi:cold shock CspA family protein